MTAAAITHVKPPKKIRLANGEHIKHRFIQQIAWSVIGAAVGAYMVSALYYLITQVHYKAGGTTILYLKPGWDGLFKYPWWTAARHDYRDCYEAVFATLFIKSIVSKKKYWGQRVATWRVATSPLLIFAVAFPVITLGIWIVDIHGASVPSVIHTYQSYLIGFVAAQVIHKVYAPIGNTVQLFFAEEMLQRNITPRWPLPPVLRERVAWMKSTGQAPAEGHGVVARIVLPVMGVILFALAGYGAYVRFVIAKG